MNNTPRTPNKLPSGSLSNEEWEALVRRRAAALPYPPTPDLEVSVATQLANQRVKAPVRPPLLGKALWGLGILLALLLALWTIPPVRAAIQEFLQIGAVRIWLVEPTPEPTPQVTVSATGQPTVMISRTPQVGSSLLRYPTSTPVAFPFNLAGATTLAEAEARAGFPIRLPAYPPDLGPPDGVFYQDLDGAAVVLVWLDPQAPERAILTLHILSSEVIAYKTNPPVVMTTTVNGLDAAWTEGPYMLSYKHGISEDWESRYLVTGHVLIWQLDGLTYRLESDLGLDEAKRMAESLR